MGQSLALQVFKRLATPPKLSRIGTSQPIAYRPWLAGLWWTRLESNQLSAVGLTLHSPVLPAHKNGSIFYLPTADALLARTSLHIIRRILANHLWWVGLGSNQPSRQALDLQSSPLPSTGYRPIIIISRRKPASSGSPQPTGYRPY